MNPALCMEITPLDRLAPADRAASGDKAFNRARLKRAGFRVPDGLVILSSATDDDVARLAVHPWLAESPAGMPG